MAGWLYLILNIWNDLRKKLKMLKLMAQKKNKILLLKRAENYIWSIWKRIKNATISNINFINYKTIGIFFLPFFFVALLRISKTEKNAQINNFWWFLSKAGRIFCLCCQSEFQMNHQKFYQFSLSINQKEII